MDPLQSPVFILGLHRSGTTLLYEMLSAAGHFNSVWAWHVIRFDDLRSPTLDALASQADLQRQFQQQGLQTRGVDIVQISPTTKEEYGFILDNHGHGMKITRRNFPYFRQVCQVVQDAHETPRRLLLKNPWDFASPALIKQLAPSAKFVCIHRDPAEVISSLWRFAKRAVFDTMPYVAMLSRRYEKLLRSRWKLGTLRRLMSLAPDTLVRGMTHWTAARCSAYEKSIRQVPEADRIDVLYRDLCQSPAGTMQRVCEFLEAPLGDLDYARMIGPSSSTLDDAVVRQDAFIGRKLRRYRAVMEQK